MAWTIESSSSASSSFCHRSYTPLPTEQETRIVRPESLLDCRGRRYRNHRSDSLPRRCRKHRPLVFATASATALLLLLPFSSTTTFSHAFRSGLSRRGSLSLAQLQQQQQQQLQPIATARAIVGSGTDTTLNRRSSSSSSSAALFSRSLNTRRYLYRKDESAGNGKSLRNEASSSSSSNKSDNKNSQKGGLSRSPFQRRDMTTESKPTTTTSLMSTKESAFFFTTPSSKEEDGVYDREVCTMESLFVYAEKLIAKNRSSQQQQQHKFCVYLAGGGSTAISTLAATPGASSFLMEGRTTYDRHSYLNACEMPDRDTRGKGFSYSSEQAAGLASRAALKQSLKLASMDDDLRAMPSTIGIGCASVLMSGEGSASGRGSVVATAADGLVLTLSIEMKNSQRSRFDEELVLSHLVLRSTELLMMYGEEKSSDYYMTSDKEFMTRAGDIITERWELPTSTTFSVTDKVVDTQSIEKDDIDMVVEEAAKRVVEMGEDAVVLLPVYNDSTPDAPPTTVRALSQTVLPNRSLVFPGSFNPVHVGHLALANAAVKTLEKNEPYVHPRRHNEKPIFFELSLANVDKPSIDPKIVASRVKKFIELASSVSNENDISGDSNSNSSPAPSFPQQWGIVLTRAPLFEEKLMILRSKVLNRLEGPGDSPRINFVIGTDTMVRILNPKYYRDKSRANMIESLLELKANGTGFIVGGRLEQSPSDPESQPRFVSGREELVDLPDEVASMFTIMEESEFRVDLSSSEIRKKHEEKKESLIAFE